MSCNSDKCHCPACIEKLRLGQLEDRVSRLERATHRRRFEGYPGRVGSDASIFYAKAKAGLEAIERRFTKAAAQSIVQYIAGAPWIELDQVQPQLYEAIYNRCYEVITKAARDAHERDKEIRAAIHAADLEFAVPEMKIKNGYSSRDYLPVCDPRHVYVLALTKFKGKIHLGSDPVKTAAQELAARGLISIEAHDWASITEKGKVMLDAMCRVREPVPATTEWKMP